jgi:hypothetical protein
MRSIAWKGERASPRTGNYVLIMAVIVASLVIVIGEVLLKLEEIVVSLDWRC